MLKPLAQERTQRDVRVMMLFVVFIDLLMAGIWFLISQRNFISSLPVLLLIIGFVDAVFVLVFFFSLRLAKRVDERWSALAEKMGWSYSMNVEFIEPNGKVTKEPGIIGKYGGRTINITTYAAGEGNVMTIVATKLERGLAEPLLVTPSTSIPFLRRGEPVISPEFDKKYSVKSKNLEYAKKVIGAIQGKLLSTPPRVSLQANSNVAVVFAYGILTKIA